MAYTILENFKPGLVRNVTPLANVPGSLWTADDVHVTGAGELQKRQDILLLEKYAPSTQYKFFGLVATTDKLYTFGSEEYVEIV